MRTKKGWLYGTGDTVFLKGTKSIGLPMYDVFAGSWPDHLQITGTIEGFLGNHAGPAYNVRIDKKYRHMFDYLGVSFAEEDLFTLNKYNEFDLDGELFEI